MGKVANCSDPTQRRLALSGQLFELGDDKRGTVLLRFLDYPLAQARLNQIISQEQFDAGERFHANWYNAGLAGHIPAIDGAQSFVVGGDNFGGMPRSRFESEQREKYRIAVQTMGMVTSRIVELIVCWRHPIAHIELGWPGAEQKFKSGLTKLVSVY